jgi:hypothetical protein
MNYTDYTDEQLKALLRIYIDALIVPWEELLPNPINIVNRAVLRSTMCEGNYFPKGDKVDPSTFYTPNQLHMIQQDESLQMLLSARRAGGTERIYIEIKSNLARLDLDNGQVDMCKGINVETMRKWGFSKDIGLNLYTTNTPIKVQIDQFMGDNFDMQLSVF